MECSTWFCTVFVPVLALFGGIGIYAAYVASKLYWRTHRHDR